MTGCVVALMWAGRPSKAVVDHDAAVLSWRRRPTPPRDTAPDEVLAAILATVDELAAAAPPGAGVRAVGLAVTGIVDERRGIAVHSENVGWRDVPVRSLVEQATGLPVGFGHDVRAGALAEWRLGRRPRPPGPGLRPGRGGRLGRRHRPGAARHRRRERRRDRPRRRGPRGTVRLRRARLSRPSPPPPPWPAATRASPGSRSPAPGRWRSGWSPATRRHARSGRRDPGAGAGPGLDDRRAGAAGDHPRRGAGPIRRPARRAGPPRPGRPSGRGPAAAAAARRPGRRGRLPRRRPPRLGRPRADGTAP